MSGRGGPITGVADIVMSRYNQGMTQRCPREPSPPRPRWRLVIASLSLGMLLFCSARGYADTGKPAHRQGLLVLFNADPDDAVEPEARFATEVALAVDQYEVIPVRLEDGDFKTWAFERQREKLRVLTRELRAIYSIWIAYNPSGSATLFVCTLLPQRSFLRTVEVPGGPDVEKELAVAARELLEEISLTVSPPPASRLPQNEPPVFQSFFDVVISARGTFGVAGHDGPSMQPGAGIGFKWWPAERVYLKGEMALDFGPYENTGDVSISGITAAPGLGIGYSQKWRVASLGPLLEFQESWTRLEMAASDTLTQTYEWWHFRVAAGLGLGIAIKKSAIALDVTLGLSPVRETIRRESDGSVELVTPLLDARVALSVLFSTG